MKSSDPYAATDKLDDSLLQVIVTRLEARAKHPLFEKMLQDYLHAMQIDTAKTVLDIGCGTGVAARAIARRRGFSGRVLGIDLSPVLSQTAAQLAAGEGLDNRVEFRPVTAESWIWLTAPLMPWLRIRYSATSMIR
jgi:ubiquinone/menaquinone biosynthesis C-methylase UbiE